VRLFLRRRELRDAWNLLPLLPVLAVTFEIGGETMKLATILTISAIAVGGSAAYAATTMTAAPSESWTVTNYYKQSVYDPKESKIGDVDDVLVDKGGKDVIVPFTSVKTAKKNDKWWLTLDESKDSLKSAPGFKYDKASTTWVPDKR
jgi:hypothetical protein